MSTTRTYYVQDGEASCAGHRRADGIEYHYACACGGRERPVVTARPPASGSYVRVRARTAAEAERIAVEIGGQPARSFARSPVRVHVAARGARPVALGR